MKSTADNETVGPALYENWRAMQAGAPAGDCLEHPLYSDASFTGELDEGYGPYKVLNVIRLNELGAEVPAALLRIEDFLPEKFQRLEKTDETRYHGAWIEEEFAALLSLSLGVRFKAGGPTRWFHKGGDPRGQPWPSGVSFPRPILIRKSYRLIIARAARQHPLGAAERITRLLDLAAADATALIRAARLHQDAMWIAEGEPKLAWLLFVSAIEAAADHWRRAQGTPRERMRASRPSIEQILADGGAAHLIESIAEQIAPYMGATKRFVDFALNFLPEPPEERPEQNQFDWNLKHMKKVLTEIYGTDLERSMPVLHFPRRCAKRRCRKASPKKSRLAWPLAL